MKRQLNQTTEWPKEPLKGEKLLFSFIPHFIIFILLIMPLLFENGHCGQIKIHLKNLYISWLLSYGNEFDRK